MFKSVQHVKTVCVAQLVQRTRRLPLLHVLLISLGTFYKCYGFYNYHIFKLCLQSYFYFLFINVKYCKVSHAFLK